MKPLLNSKSVCQILGVSPTVLSRWVHSNKIPYVLLTSGKKKLVVRFREDELELWLDRRSRGAVPKLRSSLSEVDKKPGKPAQHIDTKDNRLFLETSAKAVSPLKNVKVSTEGNV
jgi:hypothetical protein